MKLVYRVRYTEYERGWGSRPEGFTDFASFVEAKKHQKEFNSKNNLPSAPDWYMVAEEPALVDADEAKH